MAQSAPGKHHREGITLMQLSDMFPDEDAARTWFEGLVWPDGRYCPRCGSQRTHEASHAKSPYRCSDCRAYFSVKTGTLAEGSKVSLRKWAFAIYLEATSLKGIASMKLHRDIGVTQKTAWFMLHRIREAWAKDGDSDFSGPVEIDETYMGGRKKNMSKAKRREVHGRGPAGKAMVIGAKDRATNAVTAKAIASKDRETMQGFVARHAAPGAKVFTDTAGGYHGMTGFDHEQVNHNIGEYVRGMAHTNGIESFWSMLKRAHKGTFHKISTKHLQRYVDEFCARHNMRDQDTIAQMQSIATDMVGKRLTYKELIG